MKELEGYKLHDAISHKYNQKNTIVMSQWEVKQRFKANR